jgi:hypothetical protein
MDTTDICGQDNCIFQNEVDRINILPLVLLNIPDWIILEMPRMAEQSRAEQSRAEQSRAEQSRAEQSRAEQSLT